MSSRLKLLRFLGPYLFGVLVVQTVTYFMKGHVLLAGLMVMFCIGVLCNWLVVSSNGWRMPVPRNVSPASKRHVKMSSRHRFALLADIIPIGFGLASIGDLLILGTIVPMVYLLLLQL